MRGGPGLSPRGFLSLALGSGLGTGLAPLAPGTFGTLPGVALHYLVVILAPPDARRLPLLVLFLLACLASILLAPFAQAYWRNEDPGNFVMDEVAGYLLTQLLFLPALPFAWSAPAGFVLFRLFDIAKPPPVRQIDRRVKGAWGILLDDLASAVYAAAALHLIFRGSSCIMS